MLIKKLSYLFILLLTLGGCGGGGGGGAGTTSGNTTTYPISVTVTGLSGTGLVLQNNSGDNLAISSNGVTTFATPLANGASYSVTILTMPNSPTQQCTVNNPSGTVADASVTNITVVCDLGNTAFWSFDNMTGPTAPNTKFAGLDAVLTSASVVPGKFGNGVFFDNNLAQSYAEIAGTQHVPSGSYISASFPDNKISIAMWIKPTIINNAEVYHLFGGDYWGAQSFHVRIINGKIVFLLNPPSTGGSQEDTIITSASSPTVGAWTHVAVTYDGSTAKIYLNGTVDMTNNISHVISPVENKLYIGGRPNVVNQATMTFPGIIDELEFTGSVLSSDQIASLISGMRP